MDLLIIIVGIVLLAVIGVAVKTLLSNSKTNKSGETRENGSASKVKPSPKTTTQNPPPVKPTLPRVPPVQNANNSGPKADDELWNREMLSEITNDDKAMELEMIETFIESTADEWRKFETALQSNISKDAEIYAHSIKGAAKYTGAKKVADVAFEIEKICKFGDLDAARAMKPELRKAIDDTCVILRDYLDKNKVLKEHLDKNK